MKLSNIFWYILILGVVAIGGFVMYSASAREDAKQADIRSDIAATQANTVKLTAQKEALRKDLEAEQARITEAQDELTLVQTELGRAQSLLPGDTESIDYDDILFNLAHANDLDIYIVKATEHSYKPVEVGKDLEDVVFTVMTMEMQLAPHDLPDIDKEEDIPRDFKSYIDGALNDFLEFTRTITRSADFTNADIQIVDLKNLEPTIEAFEGKEKPLATVRIILYSYSASQGG
jgi:uncharacterized protein Veg